MNHRLLISGNLERKVLIRRKTVNLGNSLIIVRIPSGIFFKLVLLADRKSARKLVLLASGLLYKSGLQKELVDWCIVDCQKGASE